MNFKHLIVLALVLLAVCVSAQQPQSLASVLRARLAAQSHAIKPTRDLRVGKKNNDKAKRPTPVRVPKPAQKPALNKPVQAPIVESSQPRIYTMKYGKPEPNFR